ncbi:PAS domain S-box protein [Campylobacter sp. RM12920]|uniref:histidine kinase n=1 Tax=Campylobacter californiensis TaxID=1032243 RepID=A0ABD4JGJ4_9BACT|nr:PAS domain S-box protein [Campylobacter sp. RM12919]MBE2988938.1 PAS domain S-box protein [Campylobacter sp. RM12920]
MKFKQVIFYFLAILAVGYFYLVYTNYDENKKYTYNVAVTSQVTTVQKYKAIINERIEQQKRLLEETARFIETKEYATDYDTIKGVLNIIARTTGFLAVYSGYIDTYKFIASNNIEPQYNFSNRPWFIAAKKNMATGFTEPYVDRLLNIYVISVSTPLFKNGKFIGVLTADLDFEIFQKELATLFPLSNGSAFLIVNGKNALDKMGQILDFDSIEVKNALKTISKKREGNEQIFIKNKPYIFVYDTLANSDWILVSVLDETMIYKQVNKKTLRDLGIFLALVLFGVYAFVAIYIAQRKFYKSKHLLNLFSKNPIGGLVITDRAGNIAFINKEFEKIFGLKFKANIGKNLKELPDIFYQNQNMQDIFEQITNNPKKSFGLTLKKDELFYKVEFLPLLDKYSVFDGVFIMAHDVTHEIDLEQNKQKQEQILLQNSKMVALGEMVSAISHQYKQPLNTLLLLASDTQELLSGMSANEKALKNILNMRMNIDLMNETIDVFRNFYKEDFCEKSFDLIDVMDDVLYICRPQLQVKNIKLNFIYDDEEHQITSYPTYVKHVLMNIIINAKDELVKKAMRCDFEPYITVTLRQDRQKFTIGIEDNAGGIDKNLAKQIFEPFFTTKGGEGTGMGLYLCKLIFEKKLRGDIKLVSAANPTKFEIELLK